MLNFLSDAVVQMTKNNIIDFKEEYTSEKVWIKDFYSDIRCEHTSRVNINDFKLKIPDNNSKYDLENTRIIYDAMKSLEPYQAVDERIWSYLTHVKFWDYMRERWPAEKYIDKNKTFIRTMRERYFLSAKTRTGLRRNGISRLWWYGYLTYEEESKNPYKLTEILLSKADIPLALLERNFSSNPKLMKSVLRVLKKWIDENGDTPERKAFRDLCKKIKNMGGVFILDALNTDELEDKFYKQLKNLNEKYSK